MVNYIHTIYLKRVETDINESVGEDSKRNATERSKSENFGEETEERSENEEAERKRNDTEVRIVLV